MTRVSQSCTVVVVWPSGRVQIAPSSDTKIPYMTVWFRGLGEACCLLTPVYTVVYKCYYRKCISGESPGRISCRPF